MPDIMASVGVTECMLERNLLVCSHIMTSRTALVDETVTLTLTWRMRAAMY